MAAVAASISAPGKKDPTVHSNASTAGSSRMALQPQEQVAASPRHGTPSSTRASLSGEPLPRAGDGNTKGDHSHDDGEGAVDGEEDLPEPICGGCKKMIDEESADAGVIHFATQLWHVDCFRCAKCRNPVTTDRDDILLLSDGHPICGQCNYSCQICGLPIMEEAIMTGDESYHASCFVCRSCRTPIAELVFAKTSQGIYCMKCHNQRVARSRRHAEKKRTAAAGNGSKGATSATESSKAGPSSAEKRPGPTTPIFAPEPPKSPTVSLTPGSPRTESALARAASEQRNGQPEMTPSSSSMSTLSPFMQSSSTSSLTRPSSAGHGSKRPVNAPPPSSARSQRSNSGARPATADSPGDVSRSAQTIAQQSALAKLEGETHHSPLLASALEHRASLERSIQQSNRDRSGSIDRIGAEASNGTSTLTTSASDNWHKSIDDGGVGSAKEVSGLGIGLQHSTRSASSNDRNTPRLMVKSITPPLPADVGSTGADGEEVDDPHKDVQYKRASRLNIAGTADRSRLSRAFSFYDPDIVGLMDSFGRFESYDELSVDSAPTKKAVADPSESTDDKEELGSQDSELKSHDQPRRSQGQDEGKAGVREEPAKRGSATSITQLSETMRKSIQRARDGHVSMDTAVLETMLEELDATRERMKLLQRKYERIRRASQQAAQGFSTAREEYEQEVQARYDAEAEMLKLKRQLHMQATKLAEMATEKRQQENLSRRNHEVKSSIQDMERDLAKLRIERDVTVAEVAELVSMQDGRPLPNAGHEEAIKRNLVVRLDAVKDKYRNDIGNLLSERDALLVEVEELRQSREVFLDEAQTLNARNEELSSALVLLQNRVEHAQAAEKLSVSQQRKGATSTSAISSTTRSGAGGGFGFLGAGVRQPRTPLSAASTMTDAASSQTLFPESTEHLAIASPVPVPVTKIEAAPKKFKWMKAPKLTADSARQAGHHIAAALPGVSPPVPAKGAQHDSVMSPPYHPQSQSQFQQQQQRQQQAQNPMQGGNAAQTLPQSFGSQNGIQVSHSHKQSHDQVSGAGMSSGEIVVKEHLFQPFNVLRPVRCLACQKNMWGQSEMKCSFCSQACHVRCLHNLPISCNQPFSRSDEPAGEPSGPPMFGRNLAEQIHAEDNGRGVPSVVERCVEVVELQGMDYEGIYRKSGGTSQLKIITQLFEKGQPFDLDDRDRFNDISAITSVLKNYFRELPEPLMTFDLHERFIECVEAKKVDGVHRKTAVAELVHSLPREHFDTLRFLIRHLHRVQARAEENRMNSRNLGVVFGPTLMRSRDPAQEFAHMGGKAMTVEYLIDNHDVFDKHPE